MAVDSWKIPRPEAKATVRTLGNVLRRRSAPELLRDDECHLDFGPRLAHQSGQRLREGRLEFSPHPAVEIELPPDWSIDPLGDRNWQFQFHALRWTRGLKAAYDYSRDAWYARSYLSVLADWVDKNPHGNAEGAYAWNDHAAAWRARVLALAAESHGGAAPEWLMGSLAEHVRVLASDRFYVRVGNHALNQNLGLFAAAWAIGDQDSMRLAINRTTALLAHSVDIEGVMNEQSSEYQIYNYRHYSSARRLFESLGGGVDRVFDRLAKMPDFLGWATLPNAEIVMIGDSQMGKAPRIDETISQYAATRGEEGPRPVGLSRVFHSGYAFARTSWDADEFDHTAHLSLRFGPARQLHGHHDGGAVSFFVDGQRVIENAGKYKYESDDFREYVRSRAAQNVVVFSGRDITYEEDGDTSLLAVTDSGPYFLVSVIDRHQQGAAWTRHALLLREERALILVDELATDRARVTARHRLRLHPDLATIERCGTLFTASTPDGSIFTVDYPGFEGALRIRCREEEPLDGWISRRYGTREGANVIEAEPAQLPCVLVTVIARGGTEGPSRLSVDIDQASRKLEVGAHEIALPTGFSYPRDRSVAATAHAEGGSR